MLPRLSYSSKTNIVLFRTTETAASCFVVFPADEKASKYVYP